LHRIDPTKRTAIRFLKLFVENNRLIAEYSSTPLLPWQGNPEQVKREIIADGVADIAFTYADINPQTKQVNLSDSWDNNATRYIPLGIQLAVTWQNGRQTLWFRRTAGAGYQQQLGRRPIRL